MGTVYVFHLIVPRSRPRACTATTLPRALQHGKAGFAAAASSSDATPV